MENGAAATGCYKCGRPGHWSRDCPSSSTSASASATATTTAPIPKSNPNLKSTQKPKRVPRTRPKLTPDLLLSDDGLGYVLRHFPRAFKYRGRGHEVNDLGNLIGMYSEWHSRLLPYYSLDQFVHKVEQVATTKRVKFCLRELRERVADGGDPTKLHEPQNDEGLSTPAAINSEGVSNPQEDPSLKNHDFDDLQEDMLHDTYEKSTEEVHRGTVASGSSVRELPDEVPNDEANNLSEIQITEEQKKRMESSRLKALEKAAAEVPNNETSNLSEIQITEEQKARMELNRLKALERAAARAGSHPRQLE